MFLRIFEILNLLLFLLLFAVRLNKNLNEFFYSKVKYSFEELNEIIIGANCSVVLLSFYEIFTLTKNYIVFFDMEGLSSDEYMVIFQFEHMDYQITLKSMYLVVKIIQTEVLVLNIEYFEFINWDIYYIRYRFLSAGQDFTNDTATLISRLISEFLCYKLLFSHIINFFKLSPILSKRYISLTKFQREIRKEKGQLLKKDRNEKNPLLSDEDILKQVFNQVIQSRKRNHEEVS